MSGPRVICVRAEPGMLVTPGSVQHVCDECGAAVWVALAGQRVMRDEGAVPTCMECGLAAIAADPEPDVRAAPGSLAEAAAFLSSYRRRN